MRCVQPYDLVLVACVVGFIFFVHWYLFKVLFVETKNTTSKKAKAVRHLCSKHLVANRKHKEFIVVDPIRCEVCKTLKELA